MIMTFGRFSVAAFLVLGGIASVAGAADGSIGFGLHYWTAVDDLVDQGFQVEEDGVSGVVALQLDVLPLIKLELDLEVFPDGFGGSDELAVAPQFFVIVGALFYAGVGVGVTVSDGIDGTVSDPFYAGRVGISFAPLPRTRIDLNANYRVEAFSELGEGVDGDAVTLGAIVRLRF